ncbi:GTP 3',8-cyclase MoaA [Bryobacter aggregatus]|uniref:GTP 3',8-cyclase MoaA n=1 Tax=Bryobacter aggregatus TaxID=360054 RepID=UPI000A489C81|nr:GTP 3',8-cyclase MoaA [Bryobacter aggregatus]
MQSPLLDRFGRLHDNLRISVTDRCNIRCFYCMPEEGGQYAPKQEILSLDEIARFAGVAAGLGIRKVRITGGEPLVRKDLAKLIEKVIAIPGIEDVALTTNALLLGAQAKDLYDAGLRRLNIHLDTLDRERFRTITRRDELPRVLESIEIAQSLGFGPIKLNAVAVKGLNEDDILPMAHYGRERGIEVRFIEFMPLDHQGLWDQTQVLSMDQMLERLRAEFGPMHAMPDQDERAPATEFRYGDGKGSIGFIASVSKPFCLNCNRIRLTADGKLRYCLFAVEEMDVRALLRAGDDAGIETAIRENLMRKWIGHEIGTKNFVPPPRPMYAIGG